MDDREIRAQRIVLSAGAGTEGLLQALGLDQPAMQTRPLHMVMAKARTSNLCTPTASVAGPSHG